jgi:predicted amidohydrolase
MPRKVKVAALQMDAAPAPVADRLNRAADLIAEAVSAGAQLVSLPEVFNTGYEYTDANYPLAETIDGQTVTWMKAQAAEHQVHLAGSLMLLDDEDVYNTAFLVAPDGRLWRYVKLFPFLWERAYFREGKRITVADTDLGKLGMMICWDSAHADVWSRYAGRVDALLILSCPPKISSADLIFPDETRVKFNELGPVWEHIYTDEEYFPGVDMDEHAAWLQVPVIQTVGAGTFRTKFPLPQVSVGGYLVARQDLWGQLAQAKDVVLETGFDKQTKVIDASGQVVARVTDEGDGFTVAEVELADEIPQPSAEQPPMRTSKLSYFMTDVFGAGMMTARYRQHVRKQWGEKLAPVDSSTKIWVGITIGALLLGWLFGLVGRGGKPSK